MQSHEISAGKWNDIPCDALRDLICQADQDATLPETPSTVECIICPNHTVKYRESCYSTHSQNLNWYDAELTCQDAGGHLVSISDNFEMAFLRQLTTGKFREYWIGLRANIVHSRLFEHKDRHHLAWSDHRPVHHLTWDVDQPKYTEEEDVQCVEMNEDRLWAVSDCIDEKPFVCIKHPNAFTKSSRAEGFCPANIEGVSSRLIDVGHDKCYLVEYKMSEADGFTGSKDKCKDYGGKLAFFKTSDELKSLTPYLAPYANKHFWVGIRMEDHSFKSLDNEDFDENLWEKGEPNELHRERCVNVYAQALKYYNSPCWAPHQYICEIPKVLEIDYDPSKESGSKVESGALEGSGAFEESGMEGSGAFEDSGVLEGGWSDDEDYPDHKTPEGNNKVLQISTPADFVLDGNEDTTIHYSDDKSPEENNNVPETVTLSDFIFDGVEDNSINVYRVDNEI